MEQKAKMVMLVAVLPGNQKRVSPASLDDTDDAKVGRNSNPRHGVIADTKGFLNLIVAIAMTMESVGGA
jgi:hypothetical protein